MDKELTADDLDLVIDKEFSDCVPAHTASESEEFRNSVLAEGRFYYPILYWTHKGVHYIVDGRHRYMLWCELPEDTPIPPPRLEEVFYPDREAVKRAIIRSRLARASLDAKQRKLLIGRLYNRESQVVGRPSQKTQASNTTADAINSATMAELNQPPETAERLSEETGVPARTIERYGELAAAIDRIGEVNGKAKSDIESGVLKVSDKDAISIGKLPTKTQIGSALRNLRQGLPWDGTAKPESNGEKRPTDKAGRDIPKPLEGVFTQSKEAATKLRQASNIIGEILAMPLSSLPESGIKLALKDLKSAVNAGLAHAVCPYCKGRKCKQCEQRGYVTKDQWAGIPEERRK